MGLKIIYDVRTDELQSGDAVVCCANGQSSLFDRTEPIDGSDYVTVIWQHGGATTAQPQNEWCTVVREVR